MTDISHRKTPKIILNSFQLLAELEMQMKRIAFLSYPTQIAKLLMKTSIQEIKDLSVRSKTIATKRIFIGSQVRFRKRRLPKNHKMF